MDGPTPFMFMFPETYPKVERVERVEPDRRPDLVGLLVKSVMLDRDRLLYCTEPGQ